MNGEYDDFMNRDNDGSVPTEDQVNEAKNGVDYLQQELLKRMKGIASDLWQTPGTGAVPGGYAQAASAAAQDVKKKAEAPKKAAAAPAEPAQPEKKDIHRLWKSADTTVDWTDALIHDRPSDNLTPLKLWSLYHRLASKVLQGDLDAYAEVLTTTNPLGDLTDYVNGMVIRTPDADRLECRFECRDEFLKEEPEVYLSGLSLRIARDLLAALPVSEVYVEGNRKGERKIGTTYTRAGLQKRNPAFLDPVAFAKECNGVIYV